MKQLFTTAPLLVAGAFALSSCGLFGDDSLSAEEINTVQLAQTFEDCVKTNIAAITDKKMASMLDTVKQYYPNQSDIEAAFALQDVLFEIYGEQCAATHNIDVEDLVASMNDFIEEHGKERWDTEMKVAAPKI